jgi:lipopolysaccharide/colanic/teichoic acid biosynthesis glycosyltransferase
LLKGVEATAFSEATVRRAEGIAGRGSALLWRALDVLIAAALLLLLLPVLVCAAVVIRLDSPGPALFRQRRLGIGTQPFTMHKFRTMHRDAESESHRDYVSRLITGTAEAFERADGPLYKLADDDRVTRVGRLLRRWSIDELPQLWDVLRGEMSLVGPRPAIPYELAHYEPDWYRRFSVRPGITGLWQVSGRSRLTFSEMVSLDIAYAENRSLWLNLRILAKTVPVVLLGKGAA